jgi:hypothetical protein
VPDENLARAECVAVRAVLWRQSYPCAADRIHQITGNVHDARIGTVSDDMS